MTKGRIATFAVAVLALGLPLLLLVTIEVPSRAAFVVALLNFGHAPLFGCAALALHWVFSRHSHCRHLPYGLAMLAVLVAGIVAELIQGTLGRDAEMADVITDVLGAVTSLLVRFSLQRGTGRRIRWLALGLAAIILGILAEPVLRIGISIGHRHASFPVLADFESIWDKECCGSRSAHWRIVPAPANSGKSPDDRMARIMFRPTARYPVFFVREPYPDWRGYRELQFEVYSEEREELKLGFRIHDRRHNDETDDRFNQTLTIRPGMNLVRISLDDAEKAPAGRRMDMTAIDAVALFAVRPARHVLIYVDNFRLK